MPAGDVDIQSCTPAKKITRQSLEQSSKYGLYRHGYILGRTLGSGSYAKVKSARSVKLNKEVAIKIFSKRSAPTDFLEKFLPREIEAMRKVEHKNCVKLHDVIYTDDYTFMIMELAEGGDLLDFINSRKYLSEKTARILFSDLVSGISQCHLMKIVHRDLKCENLLLDSQQRLKISDFGFARPHEGKKLETYCGSRAYAPPEIIMGEPYNGEMADIWSMGVILYAMVAGRLPFKDSDAASLLSEISRRIYFPSRLSDECKDLIQAILTFNPKERLTLAEIKSHPWMTKSSADGEQKAEEIKTN